MTRDFDLIRKILLYVEENHRGIYDRLNPLEGYSEEEFLYHCELLTDNGFIEGKVHRVMDGSGTFMCKDLTWDGQDYLAKIKNDTVWNKVKKSAKDKGIELTIEIISRIATKIIEDQMGI